MMDAVRRVALLGTCVGLLGVLLSMIPPVLELEETAGLGWLFTLRGPVEAPDDVAVVSLSGESADSFGLSSEVDEWPRSLHADLIDRLDAAGAAVVAFDIIFDKPGSSDHDSRLADAIARAGNVILLERVESDLVELDGMPGGGEAVVERRVPPIEPLRRGALATAPFTLPVVPIRVSQFWAFGRADADTATLPVAALQAYALPVFDEFLRMTIEARPELAGVLTRAMAPRSTETGLEQTIRRIRGIFDRDADLAEDLLNGVDRYALTHEMQRRLLALIAMYAGADSHYLNYYGPARTITTVPYHHVVPRMEPGVAQQLAGKVVFVGFSERRQPEQQDAFFSVFSERSGQNLSGVEIGATAFANLLDLDSVRPMPLPMHWIVVFVWGVVLAALCVVLPALAAVPATVAAGTLYAVGGGVAFQIGGLWAPLIVPLAIQLPLALLAALLWSVQRVRQQRERIQAALGYYLPAGVVRRLAQETVNAQSNRELIFGTCLVTDAEEYTTLSESLHPEELGELMNAYYQVLVDAVVRHGGLVSDIAGDSMVVVWPAAQSIGGTHHQACTAALDVLAAVDEFNRSRVQRELPTRIGVDSGQLLLGNIGSSIRGEYRAVGDIVNTAARLQSLNRHLGTRVLLSSGAVADTADLMTRPLGLFLLLGKQTPVSVLELQQTGGSPSSRLAAMNGAFARALEAFKHGRWGEAEQQFDRIRDEFPGDGPSLFFGEQCRKLAALHPSGHWDGIVRMNAK